MEKIKGRNGVDLVWRDVSTQASSSKGAQVNREVGTAVKTGIRSGKAKTSMGPNPWKYAISVEVGSSLIPFIKGRGGSTQKKIEGDHEVKIIFPSTRKEDHIIIEGKSNEAVSRALKKIQIIIEEAVESPSLDYSHFVSLPLAIHPELVDKLFKFKNGILGNGSSKEDLGIDESIFIKPRTFHLTVLMLKLWNKDRVNAACEVLKNISSEIKDALENRPVSIRLRGLACLVGSFAKARVIYVPVEEIGNEGRLLRACQVIRDAFIKAGLVLERDATRTLTLHATVMNAKFRKSNVGKKVDLFDARGILKDYRSMDWGDYIIREAHLSQRFLFDENGYFHCCASIPFPERQKAPATSCCSCFS